MGHAKQIKLVEQLVKNCNCNLRDEKWCDFCYHYFEADDLPVFIPNLNGRDIKK